MKCAIAGMAVLATLVGPALADPWKDESGNGRWRHDRGAHRAYNYDRDYKQEFYRGPCKIERKWERNGEYKEEMKCKGYR
ncbi:hypothetical protein IVA95_17125 [Bradyrhizobium sp. 157]|uniref:hypothetical protein n=1 Tax=Bradyrhizobium sp. 157 TaxID=2782631 RepID=UPI001FFA73F8|nr:hypothetical protein [Bradyrhizobium sp. 157]MCK1639282.1 hypothetical protein [Bradyrhizobium sp. 157]